MKGAKSVLPYSEEARKKRASLSLQLIGELKKALLFGLWRWSTQKEWKQLKLKKSMIMAWWIGWFDRFSPRSIKKKNNSRPCCSHQFGDRCEMVIQKKSFAIFSGKFKKNFLQLLFFSLLILLSCFSLFHCRKIFSIRFFCPQKQFYTYAQFAHGVTSFFSFFQVFFLSLYSFYPSTLSFFLFTFCSKQPKTYELSIVKKYSYFI